MNSFCVAPIRITSEYCFISGIFSCIRQQVNRRKRVVQQMGTVQMHGNPTQIDPDYGFGKTQSIYGDRKMTFGLLQLSLAFLFFPILNLQATDNK